MKKKRTAIAILVAAIVILGAFVTLGASRRNQQKPVDGTALTTAQIETESQTETDTKQETQSEDEMIEKTERDKLPELTMESETKESGTEVSDADKAGSDENEATETKNEDTTEASNESQTSYTIPVIPETEMNSEEAFTDFLQGGEVEGEADTNF